MSGSNKREKMNKVNRHSGDINCDTYFDCQNNCPYCNDYFIHIQLEYIDPPIAHNDKGYKQYICCRCGNNFYEVYDPMVDDKGFDDWYIQEFEFHRGSGDIDDVAKYRHTVLGYSTTDTGYASELRQAYYYPVFRNLLIRA